MHNLILYVAGDTTVSACALANLKEVCDQSLAGQYELEVVNLLEEPEKGIAARVAATPTLVKSSPGKPTSMVGALTDHARLRRVLGIACSTATLQSGKGYDFNSPPPTSFGEQMAAVNLVEGPVQQPRVLIIDDFEGVHESFSYALEAAPVELLSAYSGLNGLELLERDGAEVVYLDLKMPGIDGIETLRRIRSLHPTLPVFILTGFAEEYWAGLREAAGEGLDFELLRKPLEMDEIYTVSGVATGGFGPRRHSAG